MMTLTLEERMENLRDEIRWEVRNRLSNIYRAFEIDTFSILDSIADANMDDWTEDFGIDEDTIWEMISDIVETEAEERTVELAEIEIIANEHRYTEQMLNRWIEQGVA